MSSPIVSTDVQDPGLLATVCERFTALLRLSRQFKELLEYLFDGSGDFNTAAGGVGLDISAQILEAAAPIGTVHWCPVDDTSLTAPGWLKADGSVVSRTTYAALFAKYGTSFGAGDGSSTFGLPDLRGKFARGWSGALLPGATSGSDTVEVDLGDHWHFTGEQTWLTDTQGGEFTFIVKTGTLESQANYIVGDIDGTGGYKTEGTLGLPLPQGGGRDLLGTDGAHWDTGDGTATLATVPASMNGVFYIKANHVINGVVVTA